MKNLLHSVISLVIVIFPSVAFADNITPEFMRLVELFVIAVIISCLYSFFQMIFSIREYFAEKKRRAWELVLKSRGELLECDKPLERDANSIKLEEKPVDYSDKYTVKFLFPIVITIIALLLIYMFWVQQKTYHEKYSAFLDSAVLTSPATCGLRGLCLV